MTTHIYQEMLSPFGDVSVLRSLEKMSIKPSRVSFAASGDGTKRKATTPARLVETGKKKGKKKDTRRKPPTYGRSRNLYRRKTETDSIAQQLEAMQLDPTEHVLVAGDRVTAEWKDGKWYPGYIESIRIEGSDSVLRVYFDEGTFWDYPLSEEKVKYNLDGESYMFTPENNDEKRCTAFKKLVAMMQGVINEDTLKMAKFGTPPYLENITAKLEKLNGSDEQNHMETLFKNFGRCTAKDQFRSSANAQSLIMRGFGEEFSSANLGNRISKKHKEFFVDFLSKDEIKVSQDGQVLKDMLKKWKTKGFYELQQGQNKKWRVATYPGEGTDKRESIEGKMEEYDREVRENNQLPLLELTPQDALDLETWWKKTVKGTDKLRCVPVPRKGLKGYPNLKSISEEQDAESNYSKKYVQKVHIVESSLSLLQYMVNKNEDGEFLKWEAAVSAANVGYGSMRTKFNNPEFCNNTSWLYRELYLGGQSKSTTNKDLWKKYATKGEVEQSVLSSEEPFAANKEWVQDVDLGGADTAGNMVFIHKMAHYKGMDQAIKPSGLESKRGNRYNTENQALEAKKWGKGQDKSHFITFSSNGKLYHNFGSSINKGPGSSDDHAKGTLMASTFDSMEDDFYLDGLVDDGYMNTFWVDIGKDMWDKDRVQWLQNYRRCRWLQLRNILILFMLVCYDKEKKEKKHKKRKPKPKA